MELGCSRPACRGELPFDGTDMILRYSLEHPALSFEFEDTLEVWSVGILRYHPEDGCPQCPPEGLCRFDGGTPIGDMEFVSAATTPGTPPGRRRTPTPVTSRRSSRCAPTQPKR
ncbi:hypothetical protein [Streptomyces sp. NPDC059874]|uniref:hypothetical protein n=1 Tax=Streptomyces sp. NPDC059874 TaxID=3346983 RepID=UPI003652F050